MTKSRIGPRAFVVIAVMCVFAWVSAGAQTSGQPERFDTSYVDVNTGRTGPVQISVTRWSTPAERATLRQTLFYKGQDALLGCLEAWLAKSNGEVRTREAATRRLAGLLCDFAERRTVDDDRLALDLGIRQPPGEGSACREGATDHADLPFDETGPTA